MGSKLGDAIHKALYAVYQETKDFLSLDAGWEESKHSRAENGEFGSGGGGSESKSSGSGSGVSAGTKSLMEKADKTSAEAKKNPAMASLARQQHANAMEALNKEGKGSSKEYLHHLEAHNKAKGKRPNGNFGYTRSQK